MYLLIGKVPSTLDLDQTCQYTNIFVKHIPLQIFLRVVAGEARYLRQRAQLGALSHGTIWMSNMPWPCREYDAVVKTCPDRWTAITVVNNRGLSTFRGR